MKEYKKKYIKSLMVLDSSGKWHYGFEIDDLNSLPNLHRQLTPIQNSDSIPREIEAKLDRMIDSAYKTCLEYQKRIIKEKQIKTKGV